MDEALLARTIERLDHDAAIREEAQYRGVAALAALRGTL